MLAGCQPGDVIAWSQLPAALHRRDLSVTRTAEILQLAGLLADNRVPSFTSLAQPRLALLPAPMAPTSRRLRTRSQGGPRSRPPDGTVRMNLNRVHPLLRNGPGATRTCARSPPPTSPPRPGPCPEPAPADPHGPALAVRPLQKAGTIFRDPTRGIRDGQRPLILIQPLQPAEIDQAASAAVTPAARLAVALAAVHAARPRAIRELHPGDVDLGNRRLVIGGRPARSTT